MLVSPTRLTHYRFGKALIASLLGLFSVITLLAVYHAVRQNAAESLERDAHNALTQLHSQLLGALESHAYLPALLATGHEIRDFLERAPAAQSLETLNRYLEQANRIAETADIYLMQADGLTIAASNWRSPAPFIGRNFAFRPYFQEAMQGKISRYYALGTTSGERGYYFSAPVKAANGTINGVVVVKVAVDPLENLAKQRGMSFIVTDPDDVVFMSDRSAWHYRAVQALTPAKLSELRASRRYGDRQITPLTELNLQPRKNGQHANDLTHDYLVLYQDMRETAGWQLYLLADWGRVTRTVSIAVILAGVMLLLSILLIYLLWKNQRQRRDYEQRTREDLAAKVEERTRELRHTQEELVQAAKMAALGQLSAGINHELNNPLTAIRAYADNAVQFMDIGKHTIARENLCEIVGLTERMATITRQLKTFSRKSSGQIETCDLHRALDSALSIVQPKLSQSRVRLTQQRADDTRYVQADLVWLEQILVNLISNAVEAVQEQHDQQVWITLQTADAHINVSVCDNGTGISETAMPHIFEAFFTTKTIGKGLGLGLSISYRLAKDMHGHLSVCNASTGGAIFTLSLQPATAGA
ncbi:MAG: hypothetical protein BWK73_46285 [Thiothrix lacustris]|uniref:C4-dicarboxylate transport sensor protein DctB n=1 Tax=Thiothrix lacustris TaxID=525917 RepID=A0A1Y1QAE4_9GAMM|nr:MAG: hypothetical protein BWK73_46285 [Thiothrix lacustris]